MYKYPLEFTLNTLSYSLHLDPSLTLNTLSLHLEFISIDFGFGSLTKLLCVLRMNLLL